MQQTPTSINQFSIPATAINTSDTGLNAASSSSTSGKTSSNSEETDNDSLFASSSESSVGVIAGSIGGVVAVILLVVGGIFYRRRSAGKESDGNAQNYHNGLNMSSPGSHQHGTSSLTIDHMDRGLLGQSDLWSDDVITAKRISRRDVQINQLISRGAYGEVYEGIFEDTRVAVKMLPPETRSGIHYVNAFLAEAKLTATMDHPHIVRLVGVAWNSLSDLCIVLEFMEGGDLRTLLNKYEKSSHPVGIDREKATIALHVCHALTYLHSLSPPVIHRDLKSRNVLLNQNLEAKLTDFGISRERLDQTMTAGVGTSLWMAPEVMLGERYSDKADIFSFGVVLSELDEHTLPYAQSKNRRRDSNWKQLPDAILLQQVAMGKLRVDFSDSSPSSIVELGTACVSVDPDLRPTTAEALYRLQVALAQVSVCDRSNRTAVRVKGNGSVWKQSTREQDSTYVGWIQRL